MSDMSVGRITFGPTSDWSDAARARRLLDQYASASLQMKTNDTVHACNCVGPRPGERKCPCALRAESEQGRRMVSEGVVINGVEYDLVPKRR